jgi:hypothetical protein
MSNQQPDLLTSMHWHLRYNHYPPVPHEWIDVAVDIVTHAADLLPEELPEYYKSSIDNPVRKGKTVAITTLIDALHLDDFLPQE